MAKQYNRIGSYYSEERDNSRTRGLFRSFLFIGTAMQFIYQKKESKYNEKINGSKHGDGVFNGRCFR